MWLINATLKTVPARRCSKEATAVCNKEIIWRSRETATPPYFTPIPPSPVIPLSLAYLLLHPTPPSLRVRTFCDAALLDSSILTTVPYQLGWYYCPPESDPPLAEPHHNSQQRQTLSASTGLSLPSPPPVARHPQVHIPLHRDEESRQPSPSDSAAEKASQIPVGRMRGAGVGIASSGCITLHTLPAHGRSPSLLRPPSLGASGETTRERQRERG